MADFASSSSIMVWTAAAVVAGLVFWLVIMSNWRGRRSHKGVGGDNSKAELEDLTITDHGDDTITLDPDQELTSVKLHAVEEFLLTNGIRPTSTLTWFRGNHLEAAPILRQCMNEIVLQNPWLAGKLEKTPDGKHDLVYPTKLTSEQAQELVDRDFLHVRQPQQEAPLRRSMPFEDYVDSVASFLVPKGSKHVFWKITVVPCRENPKQLFAVVVSTSHAVADGHTSYQLHNMLLSKAHAPSPLIPTRIPFADMSAEKLGSAESTYGMSPAFIIHALVGMVWGSLLAVFGPQVHTRYLLVDQDKLKTCKQEATDAKASFLSTNDVLTSWFLRTTRPTFAGFMAMDMRKHCKQLTQDHAGNYASIFPYLEPDWQTPGLIRKSLSTQPTMQRAITAEQPLPGLWKAITGTSVIVTNWCGSAAQAFDAIPNCQEDLHLPVYDTSFQAVPCNLSVCVIFRAGPQRKTAALLIGRGRRTRGLMQAAVFEDVQGLV
jgi:hypothetical protein